MAKNKSFIYFIIICGSVFTGCQREEFQFSPSDKVVGNITYKGNTIFIDSIEIAMLKEVTDDQIVFSGMAGELEKIGKDNILILGVSDKTPYGLLRKVESIENKGSELIVNTTDPPIAEAIKSGKINLSRKLLANDFTEVSAKKGLSVSSNKMVYDGLSVTLNKVEIYNSNGKTAWLDGSIGIIPEIDLSFEIESSVIQKISISSILDKIDEVSLTSTGEFSGDKEIELAKFIYQPIEIDKIIIVPVLTIKCGFTGSIFCEVSSGVRQERLITSSSLYKNGEWSAEYAHTEEYDYSDPQITANSDLKTFTGPEMEIMLFGVPIYNIKAFAFSEISADKTWSDWWKLYIGINGTSTVKTNILGLEQDFTNLLEENRIQIKSANGPFGPTGK